MSNEAQSIKPIEVDFNRPTAEFISNVKQFGGDLEAILDLFNNLVDFIDDFTGIIDDGDDRDGNDDSDPVTNVKPDSEIVDSLNRIMDGDNKALNELINLVYSEYTARNLRWKSGFHPRIFSSILESRINTYKQDKRKSLLNLFINKEQLIEQTSNWFNVVIAKGLNPPGFVKDIVYDNVKDNEVSKTLVGAAYGVRVADSVGYQSILNNTVDADSDIVTIANGSDIYTSNETGNVVNSFVKVVNELTDNNYTVDINSKTDTKRIIIAVTKQCTIKGMIGVFKAFSEHYMNNPALLEAAYELLIFARHGNYFRLISEILNSNVSSSLTAVVSNMDELLLTAISIPDDVGEQNYIDIYEQFKSGLSNISNQTTLTLVTSSPDLDLLMNTFALTNDTDLTIDPTDSLNNEAYLIGSVTSNPGISLKTELPELNLTA